MKDLEHERPTGDERTVRQRGGYALHDLDRALWLAAGAVALYLVTGIGKPADYDYFAPLARAFMSGRWWLDAADPLLHELVECGVGRYCVVYVPLPAFFVMPFVLLFSNGVAQQFASSVAGGASAAPAFLVMRVLGIDRRTATIVTAFSVAGTTLWFTAADGRAWYFAHAVGVLFASLALLAAVSRRPAWQVAALIAAAALARVPLALALPGLLWLVRQRTGAPWPRIAAGAALGAMPLVALEIAYDLLRWGVPWERGYLDLSQREHFYEHGIFSVAYIPRHLYAIFLQAPDFVGNTLFFLKPSWAGTSIVLMSPALLLAAGAMRHVRSRPEIAALFLCAALVFVPDITHGNVGWTQTGYRFSLDPQPFLLPLVAIGAGALERGRPTALLVASVAWSIFMTAYITIAVKRFDYVEMHFPPL